MGCVDGLDQVVSIDVGYACFGIVIDRSYWRVREAPPIAKWMIGKDADRVRDWVERKGGKWLPVR